MDKRVSAFIKAMEEKKLRLAIAESITCGMVSARLGNTIGTSKVLQGSIVCYTPEVKRKLFKVSQRMIDRYTTESMEVTEKLAKNLGKLIPAEVLAAVTGLASPGGSESRRKPVGTVFFCIVYRKRLIKDKKRFRGTPMEIRDKACLHLFSLIRKNL